MSGVLLSVLGPVVIGPLTFLAMQALKTTNAAIDALPPMAKRFAVAGIAIVLTLVANATGVQIACDVNAGVNCLELLDKDAVKAFVAALVAFAIHALKNVKKEK